jgi:hypothetical protein
MELPGLQGRPHCSMPQCLSASMPPPLSSILMLFSSFPFPFSPHLFLLSSLNKRREEEKKKENSLRPSASSIVLGL